MKLLAFDIGGTAVKYGVFFDNTIKFGEFPIKDQNGDEKLPNKIMEFISQYDAEIIGFCAPGPFDYQSGTGLMKHKLSSLYHVSLRQLIETKFPRVKLFFVHDATAFILGAIFKDPSLSTDNLSGVMLGTGLGYVHVVNGRVEVNQSKVPHTSLWNLPFKDGIAENYVSATAIIQKAKVKGYFFNGVKEIATEARRGDRKLLDIFSETGEQLGELVEIMKTKDGFNNLIIGGQVSRSWDLLKQGFEKKCSVPYKLVADPAKCAVWGIRYCSEIEINDIYKEILL